MEGHVLGRIMVSRQDGVFSGGGFLGTVHNHDAEVMLRNNLPNGRRINNFNFRGILQYQIYGSNLPLSRNDNGTVLYRPYLSHSGGQGRLFSILDRCLPASLPSAKKLALFRDLAASLSTLAMVVFVVVIFRTAGSAAAVAPALTILFSRWLTVFSPNLYWNLWVFFLPLVITFFFRGDHGKVVGGKRLFIYLSVACLAGVCKGLLGGFEFATVTCLLPFVPLAFYSTAFRWPRRYVAIVCGTVFLGVSLSVAINLSILTIQHKARQGTWSEAVGYLVQTAARRTHGNSGERSNEVAESLEVSTMSVIKTYLVGDYLQARERSLVPDWLRIPYWTFPLSLIMASGVALLMKSRLGLSRRLLAMHVMTWVSLLCPLSWHVVFKAHSHIHTMLNFVIWEMPFTLLVSATVLATIMECARVVSMARARRSGSVTGNANAEASKAKLDTLR